MAATFQDFTTYAGDGANPVFTVFAADGVTPTNIGADTILWTAQRNLQSLPVLSKVGVFVTNGGDGQFTITLTAADTSALSGYYMHQAQLTNSGLVTTVTLGRMNVGRSPAWTYDPSSLPQPAQAAITRQSIVDPSALYQVRRLVGDVISSQDQQQLTDEEVLFALNTRPSIYGAAAECCRYIAAQYARLVDTVVGELHTMYSARTRRYFAMAMLYDQQAILTGSAPGYAGGQSVMDKNLQTTNPDNIQGQFSIGMFDDYLPIAPNDTGQQFTDGGGTTNR